jgi:hypothetical protein
MRVAFKCSPSCLVVLGIAATVWFTEQLVCHEALNTAFLQEPDQPCCHLQHTYSRAANLATTVGATGRVKLLHAARPASTAT